MRAHEFLVEYSRDITAQKMGDKLLRAFVAKPAQNLSGDDYDKLNVSELTWRNLHTIAELATNPEAYYEDFDVNLNIGDNIVRVNRQTAPQLLQALKPTILESLLNYFESKDPTANKEYTQWIARTWSNNPSWKLEDINRGNLLGLHALAKVRRMLRPEHRDINAFKTWQEFERTFLANYNPEEIQWSEQKVKQDPGKYRVVFENEHMTIIQPQDKLASCHWGSENWCTAIVRGDNRFDYYNKMGPLYIVIPKNPRYNGERYQLHFPTDQIKDELDDDYTLRDLSLRFPGIREWIIQTNPYARDLIELMSDERLVNYWRTGWSIITELIGDLINDVEIDDEGFREWQIEEAKRRGYLDATGDIDFDKIYDDPEISDYSNYNDDIRGILNAAEEIENYNADQIRQVASEEINPGETYLDIRALDRLYVQALKNERIANMIYDVVRKIDYDFSVTPTKQFATNRAVIKKIESDDVTFALYGAQRAPYRRS